MWNHSGRIFINAARVYFFPNSKSLPPLQWRAEAQRFVYVDAESDPMMQAALVNVATIAEAASSPASPVRRQMPMLAAGAAAAAGAAGAASVSSVDSVSNYVDCECIYGVLPLGGSSSVLLYVSKKSHVTSLLIPERESKGCDGDGDAAAERRGHEVFMVRKLEWMVLPSRAPRSQSCATTPMVSSSDQRQNLRGQSANLGSPSDGLSEDEDEMPESISDEVLEEYLRVIDEFCSQVSRHNGEHSYLYYCPTLNLALSPEEILEGGLCVQPELQQAGSREASLRSVLPPIIQSSVSRVSSHSEDDRELNSRTVFQWNHMLLRAFSLPKREANLENYMSLSASAKFMHRSGSADAPSSPEPAAEEYPWSCVHMTDHHGNARFSAIMLYVPCFIRGFVVAYDIAQEPPSSLPTVQLHLVTRLSCRWAGTRYNRRGLEPGASGACANCAVTSLWLSIASTPSKARDSSPSTEGAAVGRMAVVNLLRGSVPRRWEQPADLHFKPPLKILFPNSAADEFVAHLHFVEAILPHVRKVACVDTTSTSSLEGPLSEAYAAAVHKVQRELLRNMPFGPIEDEGEGAPDCSGAHQEVEGEAKTPGGATANGNGGSTEGGEDQEKKPLRWKDPAAVRSALNRKTPIGYLKFNMKAKLKQFRYGALRRDMMTQLTSSKVGLFADVADAANETGDTSAGKAREPWVDFTRCQFRCSVGAAGQHQAPSAPLGTALRPQGLYLRVNCLDCLDRTNLFQAMVAESVLPHMLADVLGDAESAVPAGGAVGCPTREKLILVACTALRRMMAQQGIALSQMYASSDAHFVPFLLGPDGAALEDNNENSKYRESVEEGTLALRRWFHQSFRDGTKQDSISLVTLQHDPSLYSSDIESPFSRDLSSMNRLVFYGLLSAVLPFLFSVLSYLFFSRSRTEKNVYMGLCVGWVMYFAFLHQKLAKYRVTYTNQPLLGYTGN